MIGELVRPRRGLLIGFGLMVVNRLSGLVLPASTKLLIDDIIAHQRQGLLVPLVLAVILATALQGATSFALTQLLSKAGQRLIAELRQKVRAHIGRLPVAYYDATKSGAMVSRIMRHVTGPVSRRISSLDVPLRVFRGQDHAQCHGPRKPPTTEGSPMRIRSSCVHAVTPSIPPSPSPRVFGQDHDPTGFQDHDPPPGGGFSGS